MPDGCRACLKSEYRRRPESKHPAHERSRHTIRFHRNGVSPPPCLPLLLKGIAPLRRGDLEDWPHH
eukprot:6139897-Pyramimonas_sp.AAC.1